MLPNYLSEFAFDPEPVIKQNGLPVMKYEEFEDLAKSRVRNLSTGDYAKWKRSRNAFPADIGIFSYDYRVRMNNKSGDSTSLAALDIVSNDHLYTVHKGKDYSFLRPYNEAHEIFEVWLRVMHDATSDIAHILARKHQFSLALEDDLDGEMYRFYTEPGVRLDPTVQMGFDYAQRYRELFQSIASKRKKAGH